MPPRRRRCPGRAAGDARAAVARRAHLGRDRPPPRRARAARGLARLRLERREPDPARPARLGEGAPRADGAARGDDACCVARDAGLGEGAAGVGLLAVPAGPAHEHGAAAPLRRVLRRLRRALRRPPRRLRAGDEDGRGPRGLRPAEGGAGAARRRRPPGGGAASARSDVPARGPEGVRAEGDPEVRLRRVRVAARHCRPPVRFGHVRLRHPPDDSLLRGQPRRPVRDDARDRPRALRARRLARARAHAARARRLARLPRVAEPDVGEHGRPQPAVLAPLLPAAAGDVPRRALGHRARRLVPRRQLGRALADPRRGRRGDLQPAHHPPLRARAGAAGRLDRAGGAAGDLEPADAGLPRRRAAQRRPRRPPGHALGRRRDRLLLHVRARQRHLRAALGAGDGRDPRPARPVRAGRVRRPRRLAAADPLAPRAQVHATGADRARPRAAGSIRSRTSAICVASTRSPLRLGRAQTDTGEKTEHGDSRRDQRLRPDRAELLPRTARARGDIEIVAANDLGDQATMAHLLKYDSNLGPFAGRRRARGTVSSAPAARRSSCFPSAIPARSLGRPRRRRRARVDRLLHQARGRAEASRRRREEGRHLGARDRSRHHGRARRQRRRL